jgi:DnaJ-class molecular chaperone
MLKMRNKRTLLIGITLILLAVGGVTFACAKKCSACNGTGMMEHPNQSINYKVHCTYCGGPKR